MAGVNKVILIGNLGSDPEVRHLDGGSVVARFNIATSESYTNRNGERVDQTEWHRIELWDNLAKVAEQYLRPLLQQQIDTLVYGCTHYPHLDRVLRSLLPSHIKLVDPALHVATAAAQELELLGRTSTNPPTATRFCVSGSPEQFAQVAKQWLGCTPRVEKVYLRGANSLLPLDSRE